MKETYDLFSEQEKAQRVVKPRPFRKYKEEFPPKLFETAKYKNPVQKIGEYVTAHHPDELEDKPELKEGIASPSTFELNTTGEVKIQLVDLAIRLMPVDKPAFLLPFLDYLRIAALWEEGASMIGDEGYDYLAEVIQRYFVENSFDPETPPKQINNVRLIFTRLVCNMIKYDETKYLLLSLHE